DRVRGDRRLRSRTESPVALSALRRPGHPPPARRGAGQPGRDRVELRPDRPPAVPQPPAPPAVPRPGVPVPSARQRGPDPAAACVVTLAGQPAFADANLVANPGLEVLDGNGFPVCWEPSGYGDNSYSFAVTPAAHGGSNAMQVTVNSVNNGDRKAMMLENPS